MYRIIAKERLAHKHTLFTVDAPDVAAKARAPRPAGGDAWRLDSPAEPTGVFLRLAAGRRPR